MTNKISKNSKFNCLFNLMEAKVVFMGDPNVGKSTLFRHIQKLAIEQNSTGIVGQTHFTFFFNKNDMQLDVEFWNATTNSYFSTLIPTYLHNAGYVFVIFDKSNRESFDNLSKWFEYISEYAHSSAKVFLIGNKINENNQVSNEDIANFAKNKIHFDYTEISASSYEDVNLLIDSLKNSIFSNPQFKSCYVKMQDNNKFNNDDNVRCRI